MNSSDEYENANDSIRVNREGDSNEIDESDVHFEKHSGPRTSTLLGIKIDWSDEPANAHDSIRINREGGPNESEESELQLTKHFDPTLTVQGTQTREVENSRRS
jgi:hypothetical protein